MTDTALAELKALANPNRAIQIATHHMQTRICLGISNPQIEDLRRKWHEDWDLATRLEQASLLWDSDIFEARITARERILGWAAAYVRTANGSSGKPSAGGCVTSRTAIRRKCRPLSTSMATG